MIILRIMRIPTGYGAYPHRIRCVSPQDTVRIPTGYAFPRKFPSMDSIYSYIREGASEPTPNPIPIFCGRSFRQPCQN
jgi:hypothetical protein